MKISKSENLKKVSILNLIQETKPENTVHLPEGVYKVEIGDVSLFKNMEEFVITWKLKMLNGPFKNRLIDHYHIISISRRNADYKLFNDDLSKLKIIVEYPYNIDGPHVKKKLLGKKFLLIVKRFNNRKMIWFEKNEVII